MSQNDLRPELRQGCCWCDRYRAAGGGKCEPCQIREAHARLAALEAERDNLDAERHAGLFRQQALQESIDGCAQRVAALSARALAAESLLATVAQALEEVSDKWQGQAKAWNNVQPADHRAAQVLRWCVDDLAAVRALIPHA